MGQISAAVSVSLLLALTFIAKSHSLYVPLWSICDGGGNCRNGLPSDDCYAQELKPTQVSVTGLWLFFVSGWSNESPGLAEFLFQDRIGDYHGLSDETAGKVTCIKQVGVYTDYRTPALTLFYQLELITDSLWRTSESSGNPDDCATSYPTPVKSLVISGVERWELFNRDGTSVCIQVQNTTSFIPGIVRDTRTLRLDAEGVCAIIRGCTKPPGEIIRIPNSETSGVLRRA